MWKYELSHHDCIKGNTRFTPLGPRRRNTKRGDALRAGSFGTHVPSILMWRHRQGPSRIRVHPTGYNGQRERIANRRRPLPSTKHLLGWVAISLSIITTTGPRCITTAGASGAGNKTCDLVSTNPVMWWFSRKSLNYLPECYIRIMELIVNASLLWINTE